MGFNYKKAFLSYLDKNGNHYTDCGENRVKMKFEGEYLSTVEVNIFFDKDGDHILKLAIWDIAMVPKNKLGLGYEICNILNDKFRWVKFFVDSDNAISSDLDAIIDPGSAGETCYELVMRAAGIVDDSFPIIMEKLYK